MSVSWTCCRIFLRKICSPTGPPRTDRLAAAEQVCAGCGVPPCRPIGSTGRKFKLILTLHDLIYYSPDPARVPAAPVRGLEALPQDLHPQRFLLNHGDAVVTVSESTASLIRELEPTIAAVRGAQRPAARQRRLRQTALERATTLAKSSPSSTWCTWVLSCRTRT